MHCTLRQLRIVLMWFSLSKNQHLRLHFVHTGLNCSEATQKMIVHNFFLLRDLISCLHKITFHFVTWWFTFCNKYVTHKISNIFFFECDFYFTCSHFCSSSKAAFKGTTMFDIFFFTCTHYNQEDATFGAHFRNEHIMWRNLSCFNI